MKREVDSVDSNELLERIKKSLQQRLDVNIKYDIEIQVFIPYNVEVTYDRQQDRYKLTFCLVIGFSSEAFEATIDYVVNFINDHEEEHAYKKQLSENVHSSLQVANLRLDQADTSPLEQFSPFSVPDSAKELNNQGYHLAEQGRWLAACRREAGIRRL